MGFWRGSARWSSRRRRSSRARRDAALSATAPRLARDREGGWLAFLDTTPLHPELVLGGRILAGLAVAFPAIVAVGITALLAHGVRLTVWLTALGEFHGASPDHRA